MSKKTITIGQVKGLTGGIKNCDTKNTALVVEVAEEEYEIIAGKGDFNSRQKGKKKTERIKVETVKVKYRLPSRFVGKPNFSIGALDLTLREHRIPPILVQKKRGNPLKLKVIAGHHRLLLARQQQAKSIPFFIMPDDKPQIERVADLEFLHTAGEYAILHHPSVNQAYQSFKQQLIPKPHYPKQLQDHPSWHAAVKSAVVEIVDKIIMEIIVVPNEVDLTQQVVELFDAYLEYDELVSSLADELSREDYLHADLKSHGRPIVKQLAAIVDAISDDEVTLEDIGEGIELQTGTQHKYRTVVDDDLFSEFFQDQLEPMHTGFENYIKQRLKHAGMVRDGDIFKKVIGQQREIDWIVSFGEEFEKYVLERVHQLKGRPVDELFDEDFWEKVDEFIYDVLRNRLDRLLIGSQRDVYNEEQGKGAYLSEDELEDHLESIAALLFAEVFDDFEYDDEIVVNAALMQCCIQMLKNLRSKINIMSVLLQNLHGHLGLGTVIARAQKMFVAHMTIFRNQFSMEFVRLSDNDVLPRASSAVELLALLRVVRRSNIRFVKQAAYDRKLFLKPRVGVQAIYEHVAQMEKKKAYLVEPDLGVTKFLYTLPFGVAGNVTITYDISVYASVTRQVMQFTNYLNEVDKLKAVMARESDEGIADAVIVQCVESLVQLKPLPPLRGFTAKRLGEIQRSFRQFAFCLLFVEGMRNPASFVTHVLALMQIQDGKTDKTLAKMIGEGVFSMTEGGDKPLGMQAHARIVPDMTFHSTCGSNTSAYQLRAGKTLFAPINSVEGREVAILRQYEADHPGVSREDIVNGVQRFFGF